MISNELYEFIMPLGSPELIEELLAIDAALVSSGFTAHQDELNVLMGLLEIQDQTTLLESVCVIFRTACATVLKTMGVEIDSDIPYGLLTAVMETLLTFDGADDYELLLGILGYDNPPDEALCEVLEARTQHSAEDFMPLFTSVDYRLIDRMKSVLEQYAIEQSRAADSREILNRLNLYRTEVETLADNAINDGIKPGVSMEDLYNVYESQLVERPVQQSVRDLIGLSLYAGVDLESLKDEIDFFLEDLYPSIEDRMTANKLLTNELRSLDRLFKDL